MNATRVKNAVCANCGEWKTLWNAKCQHCNYHPGEALESPPLASIYLSLDRPGWSSRKTQVRCELKQFAAEIKAGQSPAIPEAEYNKMVELIRARSKIRR